MKRILYKIYGILPVFIRWPISYLFAKKFIVGISAIVEKDLRILLLKNTYQFYWALPGGYLKQGESFKESIEREIKEETGLEVQMIDILQIRNLSSRPVIDILVLCKAIGGKIKVDQKEVSEASFFKLSELPQKEDMPEFQMEYIKMYKKIKLQ